MTNGVHPFRQLEQENALAHTAHNVHTMLAIHRVVSHANTTHLLGLELPREQVYLDALSKLAALNRAFHGAPLPAAPQGEQHRE
jgi:hypothetical protein